MKSTLFRLLIICSLILILLWFYRKTQKSTEGFQQKERFLLKTDENIYDNFYSEIYDTLMMPQNRAKYEIDLLLKTLQPTTRYSRMLEVGSGTGTFLNELHKRGYKAQGIDRSKAMKRIAEIQYPDINILCEDVMDPMAYDRAAFTHIFCMDFTLYEMEDKPTFFKNCYYWLQNNGYLVLHLADKDHFNPIIPAAKSPVINSIEQLGPTRITKTEIDFIDFVYVSDFVTKGKQVLHKESFTDKPTQNIRQNERTLYMDSKQEILDMARIAGFIPKGGFSMGGGPARDAAQEVLILERTS